MTLTDGAIVAAAVFVGGLVFDAGRKAQRLDTVERDLNHLFDKLRGAESPRPPARRGATRED